MGLRILCCSLVILLFVTLCHGGLQNSRAVNCSRGYMGSDGPGIIRSHNYPFDYRNNLDCKYSIYLDHLSVFEKTVCFTFYRFHLEKFNGQSLYDYVYLWDDQSAFYGKYSQDGQAWAWNASWPIGEHVWLDTFCWITYGNVFEMRFSTDHVVVHSGFYAKYSIHEESSAVEHGGRHALNTDACYKHQEPEWTCFNRQCVPYETLCDEKEDCADYSDETYTHARCSGDIFGPSVIACDFADHQSCSFSGVGRGWRRTKSELDETRGPYADHTTGSPTEGFFVTTNFHTSDVHRVDLMGSGMFATSSDICLSFWYHMFGRDVGQVTVWLDTIPASVTRPIWSRKGNYGDMWLHAEVSFYASDEFPPGTVHFSANSSGDPNALVSIDDISMTPGFCTGEDVSCNFEQNMCGWTVRSGNWTRSFGEIGRSLLPDGDSSSEHGGRSLLPDGDSSSEHGAGMFVYTSTHSELVSPTVTYDWPDESLMCLIFYSYHSESPEYDGAYLSIHIEDNRGAIIKNMSGTPDSVGPRWTVFKVNYIVSHPHKIVFKAINQGNDHIVALDQISLIEGSCGKLELDSCDVGYFRCDNWQCIEGDGVCDGVYNCPGGEDEDPANCCWFASCTYDEFCCTNEACVDKGYRCDGYDDCKDWSDEENCASCPSGYYCDGDGRRCVNKRYLCDGTEQCPEGDDEDGCGLSTNALIGVVFMCLSVLFVIVMFITYCIYRTRDRRRPCRLPCARRESEDTDTPADSSNTSVPDIYSDLTMTPPSYYETVGCQPAHNDSRGLPPAYDNLYCNHSSSGTGLQDQNSYASSATLNGSISGVSVIGPPPIYSVEDPVANVERQNRSSAQLMSRSSNGVTGADASSADANDPSNTIPVRPRRLRRMEVTGCILTGRLMPVEAEQPPNYRNVAGSPDTPISVALVLANQRPTAAEIKPSDNDTDTPRQETDMPPQSLSSDNNSERGVPNEGFVNSDESTCDQDGSGDVQNTSIGETESLRASPPENPCPGETNINDVQLEVCEGYAASASADNIQKDTQV